MLEDKQDTVLIQLPICMWHTSTTIISLSLLHFVRYKQKTKPPKNAHLIYSEYEDELLEHIRSSPSD